MFPVPSVNDLVVFSGRPVESYSAYAAQALEQATLLFLTVTKLTDLPADPAQAALARNAILELADRLYLEQAYAEDMASPFVSETVGNYSYSKSATASKARTGAATGMLWWDIAIGELSALTAIPLASGSVGGGFEDAFGRDSSGRRGIPEPGGDVDPPYVRIS
jgi:hypothetical protein